jgi:hypothetical protein
MAERDADHVWAGAGTLWAAGAAGNAALLKNRAGASTRLNAVPERSSRLAPRYLDENMSSD